VIQITQEKFKLPPPLLPLSRALSLSLLWLTLTIAQHLTLWQWVMNPPKYTTCTTIHSFHLEIRKSEPRSPHFSLLHAKQQQQTNKLKLQTKFIIPPKHSHATSYQKLQFLPYHMQTTEPEFISVSIHKILQDTSFQQSILTPRTSPNQLTCKPWPRPTTWPFFSSKTTINTPINLETKHQLSKHFYHSQILALFKSYSWVFGGFWVKLGELFVGHLRGLQ
jgi:hypothetical protein